jgi:hypothetical protein
MMERGRIDTRSSAGRQHPRQGSRADNLGVVGDLVAELDGRSTEARYLLAKFWELYAQIPGEPTAQQVIRIQSIARLLWATKRAEAERTIPGDRESREHRRLLDRLLGDHQRSLASARAESEPRRQTYRTHAADRPA